jgi:hypothetical protein
MIKIVNDRELLFFLSNGFVSIVARPIAPPRKPQLAYFLLLEAFQIFHNGPNRL